MTLREYLEDYAAQDTLKVGDALIESEIKNVPSERVRGIVEKRLGEIKNGSRDFRF
jgi:2-iminoacetate synthase